MASSKLYYLFFNNVPILGAGMLAVHRIAYFLVYLLVPCWRCRCKTGKCLSPCTRGNAVGRSRVEFIKERSWIDPDFRERSSTKRLVPTRALSFLGM